MMRSRKKKRKLFLRARERARLDFGPEPASVLADAAATMLLLPLDLGGDEEAEADAIRGMRSPDQDTEAAEAKAMVDADNKESDDEAHESKLQDSFGRMEAALIELEEECGEDFTFIGDNIDFLVKVVGSTKSRRNKLYHWFHLIGIHVLLECAVVHDEYVHM
jgi:hypothetical protein